MKPELRQEEEWAASLDASVSARGAWKKSTTAAWTLAGVCVSVPWLPWLLVSTLTGVPGPASLWL